MAFSDARESAMLLPIPLAPPVTITTLSWRLRFIKEV
jgi:hypothetical protein